MWSKTKGGTLGMKRININLSDEIATKLKIIATIENTSMKDYVAKLIEDAAKDFDIKIDQK